MPKLTVRNNRRVPIAWAGHILPPLEETTIEVTEGQAARLRHRRGLVLLESKALSSDVPAWGAKVDDALTYVGEDRERAAQVLEAERGKGDKARKSLVERLETIITPWGTTIDSALAYVGEDKARAAAVLAAEQAAGDKARKSLVEQLEAIAAASEEE